MTTELYLLLVYALSSLTYVCCVALLERKLVVREVVLSVLPVLNTMLAAVYLYLVTCESRFAGKTIWRKK